MRLFWPEQFCERFLCHLEQCRCRLQRLQAGHWRMSHLSPPSPARLRAALRPDQYCWWALCQDSLSRSSPKLAHCALFIAVWVWCHLFAPLDPGPQSPCGHRVTGESDVISLTEIRHCRRHTWPSLTHIGSCRGQCYCLQHCSHDQYYAVSLPLWCNVGTLFMIIDKYNSIWHSVQRYLGILPRQ